MGGLQRTRWMRLCVAAMTVVAWCSLSEAHPIKITFEGTARQAGRIGFDVGPNNADLPPFGFDVAAGTDAAAAANQFQSGLSTIVSGSYTFTRETKQLGNGRTTETLVITPKAGVANFDSIKRWPSDSTHPDPGLNSIGLLVATAPTRSQLQLLSGFDPPDAAVDWQVMVLDQDFDIVAETDATNVASSTTADALIQTFQSGLAGQGVPVTAAGDTLTMETNTNWFFLAIPSGISPLQAITSSQVIPEPATVALGVLAVGATMRLRQRRR